MKITVLYSILNILVKRVNFKTRTLLELFVFRLEKIGTILCVTLCLFKNDNSKLSVWFWKWLDQQRFVYFGERTVKRSMYCTKGCIILHSWTDKTRACPVRVQELQKLDVHEETWDMRTNPKQSSLLGCFFLINMLCIVYANRF